ncbi:dTDP-glucose 4,6-dehydratase [Propionicimonas paludicola]|uniref:dTDP-glucose 4,6-dehydratase n=1 Tax=Propionicimonas paludicola TaxID=185243 RepID=A0A2A9CUZ9_9ACTN|nr:nucleoside-diphosphate sugar epimerase/dehydratase [Propionicimonas paludicola]PFG17472.1 dTDP-glucose 4,6-dehydratase [Propionicimonas paludicola]
MRATVARPGLRYLGQWLLDASAWVVAIAAAQVLRLEFSFAGIDTPATLWLAALAAVCQGATGLALKLYQGRYQYGCFEEVRALSYAALVSGATSFVALLLLAPSLNAPRSTMLIALPIAVLLMFSVRYLARLSREARLGDRATEPALIFGAGDMGTYLVSRMITDASSPYRPVGLLDDDPSRRHARVRNVDVLGGLQDLGRVAESTGSRVLVVAIAEADSTLLTRVNALAAPLGIKVKVLPPLNRVLAGDPQVGDLRDLSIEDILGRRPVDTDLMSIASYLTGRRVLVTGAGGSIGSELCVQIHKFGPSELILLDRDETGLQSTDLAICGNGLLTGQEVVLADIRDQEALFRIFDERRPEVVFHAAALKHLPMLQQYPKEAWKTNVLGTSNVLEAARRAGVQTFVNISTDKAADPTSVLGHSKRLAERLTAHAAQRTGLTYLSVRFGNVLGSRGSMLPLFTKMIEAGGPLTVTHPDVTRFFMTIPEACQLVIQAGAIGKPGEVLVLDMGEPVRILDVARRMVAMSGRGDVEIVFTGLRPGEKLHEVLYADGELDERRIHPKISHTTVDPVDPGDLDWGRIQEAWGTQSERVIVDLRQPSELKEAV